jgi:hypothetical protein
MVAIIGKKRQFIQRLMPLIFKFKEYFLDFVFTFTLCYAAKVLIERRKVKNCGEEIAGF